MPSHTATKRAMNRARAKAKTSGRKSNSGVSVKMKNVKINKMTINKGPGRKTSMRKTRK